MSVALAWRCLNDSCQGGVFEPATGMWCPFCGVQMFRTSRSAPERRAPLGGSRVVRRISGVVTDHPLMRRRWKNTKENKNLIDWC